MLAPEPVDEAAVTDIDSSSPSSGEVVGSPVLPVQDTQFAVPQPIVRRPQIAPGRREDVGANPSKTAIRRKLRMQSLRTWWHLRSRRFATRGVNNDRLMRWLAKGCPAGRRVSHLDGFPLADPE